MMTNRKLASRQAQHFPLIQNLRVFFETYQRSYSQLRALADSNFFLRLFNIYLEPLCFSYGLRAVLPNVPISKAGEHVNRSRTDVNADEQNMPHRRSIAADEPLPATPLSNPSRVAKENIAKSEPLAREKIRAHSPPPGESLRTAEPPIPILRVQRIKLHKGPDSKNIINFHSQQNKVSTSAAQHTSVLQNADSHLHQQDSQQWHQDLKIKATKAVEGSFKIPLRQSDVPRAVRLRIDFMKILMNHRENTVTRRISRKELASIVKNHQKKLQQTLPAKTPSAYSSEETPPGTFHSTAERFDKHDAMIAYAPFIQSFATLLAYNHNERNILRASRDGQSSRLHRSTLSKGVKTTDTASHWNSAFPGNHGETGVDHQTVWQKRQSRHKGESVQNTYNTFNVSISADAFSSQGLSQLDIKDELQRILTDEVRRMGIDV